MDLDIAPHYEMDTAHIVALYFYTRLTLRHASSVTTKPTNIYIDGGCIIL